MTDRRAGGLPPLRLVGDRILHHSSHSGYELLARHVPGAVLIEGAVPRPLSDIAGALFYRALQPRVGAHLYSHRELLLELTAGASFLLRARRTLFHVLYADGAYWFLRHARRLRRHWLVASYHLPLSHLERHLRDRRQLRRLDAAIVVGPSQVPFFADQLGAERVHVVPVGVDTEFFRPADPTAAPAGRPYALCVGTHLRDLPTLRRVVDGVHARTRGELEVVIVTARDRFPLFAGAPGVRLLSGVPEAELLALYRGALALLQPLEEATSNIAILESMACGLPIVASAVGDAPWYVGPDAGRFSPRGDAEGMVEALAGLLADPAERARLSAASRRRAEELSWPRVGAQCLAAYAAIVAR